MKTKSIKQTVQFAASPKQVYEALMDSKLHARFTRHKAKISREIGGKISAFDGYIQGINLELKADKKIVQSWWSKGWAKGFESKVTFSLAKSGKGTKLSFTHSGVPADDVEAKASGWKEHYWEPMKKMLEKAKK